MMSHLGVNMVGFGTACALLIVINRRYRDLFHFANAFSVPFAIAIGGSQWWFGAQRESLYTPTSETLSILFTGWCCFLVGALVNKGARIPRQANFLPINRRPALISLGLLLSLHLVFAVVSARQAGITSVLLSSDKDAFDTMAERRTARYTEGADQRVGPILEIGRISFIYYIPLAFYLHRQKQLRIQRLVAIILLAVLVSVIHFSRFPLLLLLSVSAASWVVLYRPSNRYIALAIGSAIACCVFLFGFMQIVLNRNNVRQTTAIEDQIAAYAVSSVPAYQQILNDQFYEINPHGALYTLQPLYFVLAKMKLINELEYPISYRPFVYIPNPTNVYTVLDGFTWILVHCGHA